MSNLSEKEDNIYLLENAKIRKTKLKAEKIIGKEIKSPYYIEDINKIIGFNALIKLIPYNLKPDSKIESQCPFCNAKIEISKAINGHIWIVCEKEGVLLCQ